MYKTIISQCATCKKVRTDSGWFTISGFSAEYCSNVSHWMCPECALIFWKQVATEDKVKIALLENALQGTVDIFEKEEDHAIL